MTFIHQILFLKDTRQNHWTMKYRPQWPTFILRLNVVSYWLIIPKYDVHTSNSLQDIRQNHWTMKYRLQWPTNILRSDAGSYWLIIPMDDVQPLNSFQDIRQITGPWNIGHSDIHLVRVFLYTGLGNSMLPLPITRNACLHSTIRSISEVV